MWEFRKNVVNFKMIEVKEEVVFCILCLILIDILTILFLLSVKPVTVIEAQSRVRLEGFDKIEYSQIIVNIEDNINSYNDIELRNYAKSDLQDTKLNYYFFIASKNNVDYAVLVDVITGEVMK
jgi:uncharacterized protein YpmS